MDPSSEASASSEAPPPLTPEQSDALTQAEARQNTFAGAAKWASFNGWSIAIFAGLTLLFGLGLFDPVSLGLGVGMAVVAKNEFKGRDGIRQIDPQGPELLWRNQIGLGALIAVYCLWSIYRVAPVEPDPQVADLMELLGSDADQLLGSLSGLLGSDTNQLMRSATLTVYKVVIGVTALTQGLMARYYYLRVAAIEEYRSDTPAWVMELHRKTKP